MARLVLVYTWSVKFSFIPRVKHTCIFILYSHYQIHIPLYSPVFPPGENKNNNKKVKKMMTNVCIWQDEREGNTCLKRGLKNFEQCLLTQENDECAIGNFHLHS